MNSGPYAGLAIWQDKADTSALAFGVSFATTSTIGPTIYSTEPRKSVMPSLSRASTINVLGIVAQTLAIKANVSLFGAGGMNIGTKPPTITSTSPSSTDQGAVNQDIVITGTTFENGATASFSNPGITVNSTMVNSQTQITANVSIATTAATGPVNVTVTNPDGGFGTGNNLFTVAAAPTLTATSPSSRSQGAQNQNITLTGTGFLNGAFLASAFANARHHRQLHHVRRRDRLYGQHQHHDHSADRSRERDGDEWRRQHCNGQRSVHGEPGTDGQLGNTRLA